MSASSAACHGRLAGLGQHLRQRLLDSDRSPGGVAAWKNQRRIAVALEDEQGRDVGAKVLYESSFRAKHRTHRGVRTADRFVVHRETVLDPGHVNRLCIHALGLQLLNKFKSARVIAGKRFAGLLLAAVIELQAPWTFRTRSRSRSLRGCRVGRDIGLPTFLENVTLRPALQRDGEREWPLALQALPEVGPLEVGIERGTQMLTTDAQTTCIIVSHRVLQSATYTIYIPSWINRGRLPTRSSFLSGWPLTTLPRTLRSMGMGRQTAVGRARGAERVNPWPEIGL